MADQILKSLIKGLKQDSLAAHMGNSVDVYSLEVEILYYIFQDKTEQWIANKIGNPKSRASVYNLKRELERRFGRSGYSLDQVRAAFLPLVPVVDGKPVFEPWEPQWPDDIEPEPEEDPSPIIELEPESEPEPHPPNPTPTIIEGIASDPSPPQPEPSPPDPRPEPRVIDRRYYALPGIMGAIILGVLALALWQWIRNQNLLEHLENIVPEVVEVTTIATEIVEATVVVEKEVTRVVESIEEVPIEVTKIVEVAAVTNIPVTVEVTSVPTATPTPTPIPVNVTITEDFEDADISLPDAIVGQDYSIRRGVLHVEQGGFAQIRIGDETWRNYTIEYDHTENCMDSYIYVRRLDENNGARFNYKTSGDGWGWWVLYINGEEIDLDVAQRWPFWGTHIYIQVLEEEIVHIGAQDTVTLSDIEVESGSIVIHSLCGDIDNLVITRND